MQAVSVLLLMCKTELWPEVYQLSLRHLSVMAQLQVGVCLWDSCVQEHAYGVANAPFLIILATMDYSITSRDLIFSATTSSHTVEVPILEDTVLESSETINVTLTSVDPAAMLNPASAVITIEDNDSK